MVMKSVPWRVLGSLVALGLGAPLSGSAEELPQPGKYAGTLTVRHIVDGKAEDPDVVARAVYRVSGRVGSNASGICTGASARLGRSDSVGAAAGIAVSAPAASTSR